MLNIIICNHIAFVYFRQSMGAVRKNEFSQEFSVQYISSLVATIKIEISAQIGKMKHVALGYRQRKPSKW